MYARVITSQYQLDKLDEGIQLYRESILPELKQLPRLLTVASKRELCYTGANKDGCSSQEYLCA